MSVKENTDSIRQRLLALIEAEYESDAAFERSFGLADKTVNNWRRGRSASFMRMLPKLSATFHVSVSDLLDIPVSSSGAELSEEELRLVHLYRRARTLPKADRQALAETLLTVMNLYINSHASKKEKTRRESLKKERE